MKHAHIILIALSTIAATGCLPGEDVFIIENILVDVFLGREFLGVGFVFMVLILVVSLVLLF